MFQPLSFQSRSSVAAPLGFEETERLVYPTRWSGQCSSVVLHASVGSPHSTPLGVRYTLERHAGMIRDPRFLKKLRNSHELHCGRWINRPWRELLEDFLKQKAFLVCWELPFNCLWMSFSWFGLMLVFQMLMLFYTDGRSNFKVHILCQKLQLTSKIRIFLKIGWCLHACFVSQQHTIWLKIK